MRTRTAMTIAGSAASVLLLGGIAYAAVQSVDDRPGPQVVIPSASPSDRHHARHGADDPPGHDANDDRNRGEARHGDDDPATHDLNDDHGGDANRGPGSDDDPATHDLNDDHGGDDAVTDDHSNRGPGSDDSGSDDSGSDDSGSDDSGSGHGGHGDDD